MKTNPFFCLLSTGFAKMLAISCFCLVSLAQASGQMLAINSNIDFKVALTSSVYDLKSGNLDKNIDSKFGNVSKSTATDNEKIDAQKDKNSDLNSEWLSDFAKEELGLKTTTPRRKD